jgi:hypothetical protein
LSWKSGVLVGIIGAAYPAKTILDKPEFGTVLYHAGVPQF